MPETKTKTISQKINFACKPSELYDALMDSKKHSFFTQSKAVLSENVGGKFTVYEATRKGRT